MKSARKIILLIIVLLFAVIIAGIIILYNNRSVSYEGTIYAAIDSKIIISRDKNGIPLVKARSMNDAYFSVGFLHCQDRQAIIEYFRAIATGRLSELIGKDGFFMDRLSLTIGFARKAEKIISKIKTPYYDYLVSYVKGINTSRIVNGTGSLSRFSFRDWTIQDAMSILLLFDWVDALQNNKELIFPVHAGANRYLKKIIPQDLWYEYSDEEKSGLDLLLRIKEEVKKHVGLYQSGFAFHLNGKDLKEGKAVSGFTLDSNIDVFPKWYPLRLIIMNHKLDCITASGLPFLLYGRNNQISFFGFNLRLDTQNFLIERVRKINDVEKYYRNGAWYNFNIIDEKIYSGDPGDIDSYKDITIRFTDTGPVISDITDDEDNNIQCISMSSIFPDENYIKSLFILPFVESVTDAGKIIRSVISVPKSYLFASENNAVCAYSGTVFRYNNRDIFIKDNTSSVKALIDLSSYSRCYRNRNIVIGNEIYSGLPAIISSKGSYIGDNRYLRLKRLIEKKSPLMPEDIAFVLKDTYSVTAEKFVPLYLPILEQFPIPSAKLCSIYFEEWDYKMNADSVAATIYELLMINLIRETIADELGDDKIPPSNYSLLTENMYQLMLYGNSPVFDDIITKKTIETRDMIFDRAFIKTLRILNKKFGPVMENWKWGKIHKGKIMIPLIDDTILNYRYNMRDEAEFSGGNNTVLKGSVDTAGILKPITVSTMSGIFYIDLNLFFLKSLIPQSVIPSSDFYRDIMAAEDFINIDMSDISYTCTILPESN